MRATDTPVVRAEAAEHQARPIVYAVPDLAALLKEYQDGPRSAFPAVVGTYATYQSSETSA